MNHIQTMSHMERLKLQQLSAQMREIAGGLVRFAPSAAVRAGSLATEIELRIKMLEALR